MEKHDFDLVSLRCEHFGGGCKQCCSREMADGYGSSAGLFLTALPKSRVSTRG